MQEEKKGTIGQKFAVICYLVAVCIGTVLSLIVQMTVKKESNAYIYLAYLLPQVAYIGTYLVVRRVMTGKFEKWVEKEGIRPVEYVFALLLAAGLLFFAILPNTYVTMLFEKIGLHATVIIPTFNVWYDYVLATVLICVLPAIGEELIFRKAFLDGMSEVADHKAILLCGLCFSLSHLNPAQTVHQFFLGCVLALCYVLTRNVTITMVMHFANNVLALYLGRIGGDGFWNTTSIAAISCAAGAVAIAVGLWLLIRGRKGGLNVRKTGKVETPTWVLAGILIVAWVIITAASFLPRL